MPDEAFGPLVSGADVGHAVLETLKLWTPTYLAWAERKTGRSSGALPKPRTWELTTQADAPLPTDNPPTVLVVSPGLAGPPLRDGGRMYRAPYSVGFAVTVAGRDRTEANDLAWLYTAVLRTVLLQKPSLGGIADGITWTDEEYDVTSDKRKRQLGAGQATFEVELRDVVKAGGGPPAPTTDPTPSPPKVTQTEVVISPKRIEP